MPLRVLIVEDDPIIAKLISEDISEAGYQVVGIDHEGQKVWDLIASRDPNLILLDINLGHCSDGIKIGQRLHDKYKIPFIYITAYSDKNTLEAAKSTRPSAYVVKPYKKSSLLAAIEIGLSNFQFRSNDGAITRSYINQLSKMPLTDKEFDIVSDLTQGLTNNQIANNQNLSINTIKWHLQNIYSKLDTKNRTSTIQLILNKT